MGLVLQPMTRQFNIDTRYLCDQHLQGEYHEIHKLLGGVVHHKHGLAILAGQQKKKNIDLSTMFERYEQLQVEMARRGNKHDAVLKHKPIIENGIETEIDSKQNAEELYERCEDCRARIEVLEDERDRK